MLVSTAPNGTARMPSWPQPSWIAICLASQSLSEPTVDTAISLPLRSAIVLIGESASTIAEMLRGGPAKAATPIAGEPLADKRHPRSAAEPEIDAAGGKRLLHLGVAAEIGAVDIEAMFGEEALRDTDIDRQEGPGGALRLADTDLLVGARGLRTDEHHGGNQQDAAIARCALRYAHGRSLRFNPA